MNRESNALTANVNLQETGLSSMRMRAKKLKKSAKCLIRQANGIIQRILKLFSL